MHDCSPHQQASTCKCKPLSDALRALTFIPHSVMHHHPTLCTAPSLAILPVASTPAKHSPATPSQAPVPLLANTVMRCTTACNGSTVLCCDMLCCASSCFSTAALQINELNLVQTAAEQRLHSPAHPTPRPLSTITQSQPTRNTN
jgi:hypothetical protein